MSNNSSIDTFLVTFDIPLKTFEIPKFRGAVMDAVGRDLDYFHNHDGKGLHYRYPRIQYRVRKGRATIFAIGEAIPQARKWVLESRNIFFRDKVLPLRVYYLTEDAHYFDFLEKEKRYRLSNWLPFNEENYAVWKKTDSLKEKIEQMERILTNQLVGTAKQFGYMPPEKVKVTLTNLTRIRKIKYHKVDLLSANIEFKTNIKFPNHIGLGKAVSHGFGCLEYVKINSKVLVSEKGFSNSDQ